MINNKIFEHRPIDELIAIVRNDFRKFDQEGLIDEGTLIKTVMYCNDKLGIPIREIRQVTIDVIEGRAELPVDFEKLYFVGGIKCTNTTIQMGRNPFDNNFDQTVKYEACLETDTIGCIPHANLIIKREGAPIHVHQDELTQLSVVGNEGDLHIDCPNRRRKGKYQIAIKDGYLETPFRAGTLYVMYLGMMKDEEGNITFPFHPMITPYYEWMIKEKILTDALFNSDAANIGEILKFAQQERLKAWIDAYNFTSDRGFGEFQAYQRRKELSWYNQYFKFFQ